MGNSAGFLEFVVEQLDDLGDVAPRAMFGGHGLYAGPVFFGIVYEDRLYLKTDDATREWFESRGMEPFRPNERQTLKTYFEVPADSVESRDELVELAFTAVEAARGNEGSARRSSEKEVGG